MRIEKLNGLTLELYTDIEELPIVNFQEFNRLMLIDSGVGGDLEAIDRHLGAILRYNKLGQAEKLQKEAMNLRQNLAFCISGVTPKMAAFVPMIKSVNGQPVEDFTEEGVARTLALLNREGATFGWLRGLVDWFKKKIEEQLEVFFPALTNSARVNEYYLLLKRRTLAVLGYILEGKPQEEIEVWDEKMFLLFEPKTFSGKDGEEVRFIRRFEETCVLLGQQMAKDPKQMTVVEFYFALEIVKKQMKQPRGKASRKLAI